MHEFAFFLFCVCFLYSRWWSKHTVAQAICQTVCQLSFRATFFLLLSVYFCSGFAIASFFLLQFHCKAHVNPPFVRSFLFFSFRLPPDSRCILSFWVYKMQCILLSLASFSIFFSSCLGFPATILTINKQQHHDDDDDDANSDAGWLMCVTITLQWIKWTKLN